MKTEWRELRTLIEECERIVFFGGAGVSTASGIPDFRGSTGLYREEREGDRPEEILHARYLARHPERFFSFYRERMLYPWAEPNGAHRALAALEQRGKLSAVITQNIDGLHTAAGSERVYELHGSVLRNYCVACGREYPLAYVQEACGVPYCTACASLVRPDVVLYGEGLDGRVFEEAARAIAEADLLIVGGTSLTVHPAASLVEYFTGDAFAILNLTPTPYDGLASLLIRDPIDEVLEAVILDV